MMFFSGTTEPQVCPNKTLRLYQPEMNKDEVKSDQVFAKGDSNMHIFVRFVRVTRTSYKVRVRVDGSV